VVAQTVHSQDGPGRDRSAVEDLPDLGATGWTRSDAVSLAVAAGLIVVAGVVGRELLDRGVRLVLPTPPVLARWSPHLGWGTPLAVLCVVVGLQLQRRAAGLSWRRLFLAGWLLSLAWLSSLRLVDGLQQGWTEGMLNPNGYLHEVPRIADPASFLATFTDFIAFGPGVDGTVVWTTHVAGHPPLATLLFWGLDRVGLAGGFWAALLCVVGSSVVSLALPVTLRELGAGAAARRLVPFVALFPGAVWMAVSADGLFAGVAVGGLSLACLGAARGRPVVSLAGGLLLGATVFLSYGLVLVGLAAVVILLLTTRRHGLRGTGLPWLFATAGAGSVAAIHLAYGFNWVTGLAALRIRYYQGIASDRPFAYFAYANVAAWLIACSPLLAVAIVRAVRVLIRSRRPWTQAHVVSVFALSGVAMATVADLSALSKAETERIWLTFGAIAASAVTLLRGRGSAWVLMAWAGWGLAVKHLLLA
jgi:methylthioxylose transferase